VKGLQIEGFEMHASDIMTTPVITVRPATSVAEIARLLLERRISGVPVVDGENRVTGMVSEADFMHRQDPEGDCSTCSWLDRLLRTPEGSASAYIRNHGLVAGDIMSSPVISIVEDTSIQEIVRLLERKRIKRLPVLKDGRLTGIVTRSDILAAVACGDRAVAAALTINDEEIRQRLEESLSRHAWAASPYSYYSVEQGTVRFWGIVDSPDQKRAFELAARRTQGVRQVVNHLSLIEPFFYYGE
jgi:CBS domain-containing protein